MRTLQKRSIDTIVEQLLANIGDGASILGPGASIADVQYVGSLRQLLSEAGVPEPALAGVRPDLIVVKRLPPEPIDLVCFSPSVLRVANADDSTVAQLQSQYGDALNVTVQRTRFLETDLKSASLEFRDQFFAPRSILGWAKLSRQFARLCHAMLELKEKSRLDQRNVFYTDQESALIRSKLVGARG